MTDTKWTPGPWVATRSKPEEGYDCWCITATPFGEKEIAEVSGGYPRDTHEACAHLIAAAPDLYHALQYARNLIGPDEILDAALAKARGE